MHSFVNLRLLGASTARAALFAAAVAGPWATCLAADTEETNKLDEIIVTAQRREQNMQDIGTSVTAFDANTIKKLGFSDVTDIVGQVPGMQFNQYGATVTIYNLRGVSQNDFSDHQEAPIAVYADDAYIGSTGALAGSPGARLRRSDHLGQCPGSARHLRPGVDVAARCASASRPGQGHRPGH